MERANLYWLPTTFAAFDMRRFLSMFVFKQSFNMVSSGASYPYVNAWGKMQRMNSRDLATQEVGRRLEAYIKQAGMNYVQFAKAVAAQEGPESTISPQTVTHWRKTGKIARERLKVICMVLGITPNDLLGTDPSHSNISENRDVAATSEVEPSLLQSVWVQAPPAARALAEIILKKSSDEELSDDDIQFLLGAVTRISKDQK